MRARYLSVVLLCGLVVASCSQNASNGPTPVATSGGSLSSVTGQGRGGNSPLAAVMQFGQANVGSPFPPGSGHDRSGHAVDNLVPRTVVIKAGGTVTFNVPAAVHQIRIYKPGTTPEDIDTSPQSLTNLNAYAGCANQPPLGGLVFAPLIITDDDNLEIDFPIPCLTAAQRTHTFTTPGRYLVLCGFLPHFNIGMYGWVEVKEA